MMQEEELLKHQAVLNQAQYQSRAADTNTNESVAAKYIGYDPELRLAKLQDANGNIFYGKPDTNSAIARGEDIRLRQGYGLPGYDAMPCSKKEPTKQATSKPIAPTYYFVNYQKNYGFFLDTRGVHFTQDLQCSTQKQKIIISNNVGFQQDYGVYKIFTYFSFEPFIPLLTLTTFITLGFLGLEIESVKLKLKINTSYALTNLDIAYFVNESNATIVESVPSPLYLYLAKNSTTIFSGYGNGSYGSREIKIELTAADFSQLESGEQQATLILGGYIRAQESIFYGGVGYEAAASISHNIEVEIESINNIKMNLKRKIPQE
ncbi:MAG: hypothetical protein RMY36_031510 [Nostoc sp. SerVER01]|nr:hypothetical protein [Nostoc sp. SerVER01]